MNCRGNEKWKALSDEPRVNEDNLENEINILEMNKRILKNMKLTDTIKSKDYDGSYGSECFKNNSH